ncbi:MAG: glycosyltransferase family 2 protein [Proteobacteria bacterium]|nr:glycosyltransferase family 2 protein [Pseudomonadota bacterium]
MDSSPRLSVSIVVPVHNGGLNFERCLLSLKALAPGCLEIIVVADGCTDASSEVASKAGIQVINLPGPGGPARARNMGAGQAKGKILFFIDADVTVLSDAVTQIGLAFDREPELAAVIGSYDDSPGQTNFLSQYKNLLHHYTHQTGREEGSTFWGACGAIRRDIFFKMGGFNQNYRKPSVEDIELGYRLRRAGYKIRLLKSLQVKHLKGWGVISLLKSDILYRAVPWTELILRDRMFIDDLNLKMAGRISVFLVYGLLISLLVAMRLPGALLISVIMGLALFGINFAVYRFFKTKRGLCFTLKAVLWHWFYYGYCGLGFILGVICYQWRRIKLFSGNRSAG